MWVSLLFAWATRRRQTVFFFFRKRVGRKFILAARCVRCLHVKQERFCAAKPHIWDMILSLVALFCACVCVCGTFASVGVLGDVEKRISELLSAAASRQHVAASQQTQPLHLGGCFSLCRRSH